MAGFTPSRDQLNSEQDSELWKSLENKDLYKVLGIASDASDKDIVRAYRRKARDVHPDKHSDALSTERFKELSNAKEFLLDVERRWWYDQRRQMEAEVISRALEQAKLRAKAKEREDERWQDLAADERKLSYEMEADKDRLAKFVEQAEQAHLDAVKGEEEEEEGESSDEDGGTIGGQLRASAPEFVPAGAKAASATPAADRVVEIYSVSNQKWCLGLIVAVNPLMGGRAALTVRYQVTERHWHEKMLYDSDPNLRKCRGVEKDGPIFGKGEMRAEAPAFVPASYMPNQSVAPPNGASVPSEPARRLQVTVPPGCTAGQHISIITPAGQTLKVQVPPGFGPGQTFLCHEPPVSAPTQPASGPRGVPNPQTRPPVPQPCGHPARLGPQRQFQVAVPPGCVGGQFVHVDAAGHRLQVQVPTGLVPGQTFCVHMP